MTQGQRARLGMTVPPRADLCGRNAEVERAMCGMGLERWAEARLLRFSQAVMRQSYHSQGRE